MLCPTSSLCIRGESGGYTMLFLTSNGPTSASSSHHRKACRICLDTVSSSVVWCSMRKLPCRLVAQNSTPGVLRAYALQWKSSVTKSSIESSIMCSPRTSDTYQLPSLSLGWTIVLTVAFSCSAGMVLSSQRHLLSRVACQR